MTLDGVNFFNPLDGVKFFNLFVIFQLLTLDVFPVFSATKMRRSRFRRETYHVGKSTILALVVIGISRDFFGGWFRLTIPCHHFT